LWAIGNSGARPLRAAAADGAAASRRAIELQPNDPLALEVHTRYLLLHDYQPIAAFKSAKAAAKLAPNDVATLLLLGYIATYLSENLIARESLERARTLDPLSLDPLNGLVNHLIFAREYTAALALCEEILRREPGAVITGWNRAHCYRMLGRIDAARAAFADTVNRSPSSGNYLALMEAIFTANEGRIDDARAQRAHALAELPWADDPMTYAILDALIGDDEGVYCAWESAIAAHDPYVYSSYYHVEFDRIRHEERFQRITHALGLPPTATPKIKIRPR
jgi:tetratricopeptide (TPR) repeat protein